MRVSVDRRPLRYPIPRGFLGPRPGPFYATWLGRDERRRWRFVPAVLLALLVHVALIGSSFFAPPPAPLPPPGVLTQSVTLQKPLAPPLDPTPPPPPPPPPRRAPSKAPAAAAAGQVVAVAPAPDRPLDMTSFDMVIGKGNVYAGGVTASAGTSLTAGTDARATAHGAGPSRARAAAPARTDWACAWPKEEEENTDLRSVRVLIAVHVDRDGDAQSVETLGPAAPPFERAARQCALNESYVFARDETGRSISGTTPPFSVHFFR
jgi:periplasmic protein TonB